MNEIYRKLILLGLVLFIGIGTIYTYSEGGKQDKRFTADYQSYQTSLVHIQEENFEAAIEQLMDLHNNYPDQANIIRNLGLVYAMDGEMEKAALYYQKAVDKRPFFIQDPMFSLQFGEILFAKGEYEVARQYLQHSKRMNISEEYIDRVNELLTYLDTIK